jgi:hypothetical protein
MEAVVTPGEMAVPAERTTTAGVGSYSLTTLASVEAALADGLQEEWRRIVDNDPLASLFQASGWCMPWYRCYQDSFDPYVIVVSAGSRVVGLVPMAVDRQTRELAFASNAMADTGTSSRCRAIAKRSWEN